MSRAWAFLRRHREVVVLTVAALIVRLVWNLVIHRPLDYAVSDMGGYLERAQTSIDQPDGRFGYFTLFPWGTHFLLSLVKRAFGRDNATAVGVTYALLGAGAVAYSFLFARRLTRRVWPARVVGAILVFYYPWISLGGYTLSEPPFTLFLAASAYYALLLADRGRPRDAWLFGVTMAIACLFRPQILVALPLYGLHWLVRRRAWRRFSPRLLVGVAVPLVFVLGVSAARVRFHTGKLGFVAGNGPLNLAFGRCHALTITSVAPDRAGIYSPPSLGALSRYGKEHPDSLMQLDPVMDTKLSFEGHMWDAAPLNRMALQCVRISGFARQLAFSARHVVLLWGFNLIWPDQNMGPKFHVPMEVSSALHNALILPAALVAMALSLRRRNARVMLAVLHVVGLVAVAMIYFGDARLRAPYDGVLLVLAVMTYASAYRKLRRWMARRSRRAVSP
jgi:4-amino-4-deoxy-L-arabinose transferase-like glycosyltransferase